jgi:hypothetical protein
VKSVTNGAQHPHHVHKLASAEGAELLS